MRMLQPHGLPSKASEFIKKFAVRINSCPHCGRHDGFKKTEIVNSDYPDPFDEVKYTYQLNDGSIAEEFEQYEVWSSGPMTWLGLHTKAQIFLHSPSTINNATENETWNDLSGSQVSSDEFNKLIGDKEVIWD